MGGLQWERHNIGKRNLARELALCKGQGLSFSALKFSSAVIHSKNEKFNVTECTLSKFLLFER